MLSRFYILIFLFLLFHDLIKSKQFYLQADRLIYIYVLDSWPFQSIESVALLDQLFDLCHIVYGPVRISIAFTIENVTHFGFISM